MNLRGAIGHRGRGRAGQSGRPGKGGAQAENEETGRHGPNP